MLESRKRAKALTQLLLACGAAFLVLLAITAVIMIVRGSHSDYSDVSQDGTGPLIFHEFRCAEGKFRVFLPGLPSQKSQNIAGMNLQMYTLQYSHGAYMAAYVDTPIPSGEAEWRTQQRLDGARQGALGNVNGQLIRESRIRLHGREPGREIEANLPGQAGVLRGRFYVVNRRMYQVMVIGNPTFVHSDNARRFLDSFSLIN
jgi:hypothetical protein